MADPQPAPTQTPEEFLESEIEDLERNTLNSGRIWAIALLGLIVLASAAWLITRWDNDRQSSRVRTYTPEALRLIEPAGRVDEQPLFRWDAVDGAASYVVQVRAAGRDEVELIRPVRETFLRPSESESVELTPGDYTWSVEARSSRGTLIGYGEGAFTIGLGR